MFDLFSPFGSVFIGWVNERSAFVALQNSENIKKAAGQLVGVSGRDYKVYFYSTYVNQLSKSNKQSIAMNNSKGDSNKSKNENDLNSSNEKRKRNKDNGKSTGKDSGSGSDSSKDIKKIKTEWVLISILVCLFILFLEPFILLFINLREKIDVPSNANGKFDIYYQLFDG